MALHNPPHPGEFLQELYLEPGNISIRELAGCLQVSASTLQRLISCQSRLSLDMALRLSRVVGRSAESWLALQDHHDLWWRDNNSTFQGSIASSGCQLEFRLSLPA